jgi:group I intron endonuclease
LIAYKQISIINTTMGYIYKITNLIDNKCYIGQTINTIEERWRNHLKKSSNCIYLKHAIDKYGVDNFIVEQLEETDDLDMLNKFEIIYILKYNSLIPNGYNIKHGGNSGGKHNDETKEKIKNSLIKNIHKCIICENIINGGKHKTCSNECRIRNKEFNNTKQNMKVVKYDMNGNVITVYDSGKIAAQANNVTNAAISMICNGKRKQLKGFIYKFSS